MGDEEMVAAIEGQTDTAVALVAGAAAAEASAAEADAQEVAAAVEIVAVEAAANDSALAAAVAELQAMLEAHIANDEQIHTAIADALDILMGQDEELADAVETVAEEAIAGEANAEAATEIAVEAEMTAEEVSAEHAEETEAGSGPEQSDGESNNARNRRRFNGRHR